MSTENTQPSQAPESTEEKAKKPVPEEFFRQPYSFVRRGDRLTARRQKAWDTYSPTHVLDIPRLRTDTSVSPEATFDPVKIYGREAYQVVEIGSGLGEAIVHRAAEVPEANFLAVEVYTPGIADLLLKMGNAGVENVRVAQANAPELLDNMLEENSVDELWVFCWSPPVPTMSTAWGLMSTVSALAIMPAASAPSSSGVSPLEWRAVRKDARIGCSVWPVMMWSIAQATSVSVRFWCLTSWLRMYFQVISCVVMC